MTSCAIWPQGLPTPFVVALGGGSEVVPPTPFARVLRGGPKIMPPTPFVLTLRGGSERAPPSSFASALRGVVVWARSPTACWGKGLLGESLEP